MDGKKGPGQDTVTHQRPALFQLVPAPISHHLSVIYYILNLKFPLNIHHRINPFMRSESSESVKFPLLVLLLQVKKGRNSSSPDTPPDPENHCQLQRTQACKVP